MQVQILKLRLPNEMETNVWKVMLVYLVEFTYFYSDNTLDILNHCHVANFCAICKNFKK